MLLNATIKQTLLMLAIQVCVAFHLPMLADQPESTIGPEIQGDWLLEYRVIEGKRLEGPPGLVESFLFSKTEVTIQTDGLPCWPGLIQRMRLHYKLKSDPKAIDFQVLSGLGTFPGIYRMNGKKLEIVWNLAGKERPSKFEGTKTEDSNENMVLMVFRRKTK